jgi:hypothetical protein
MRASAAASVSVYTRALSVLQPLARRAAATMAYITLHGRAGTLLGIAPAPPRP